MNLKIKQFLLSLIVDPDKNLSEIYQSLLTLSTEAKHSTWRPDHIRGVVDLYCACIEFEKKNLLLPLIKVYESVNYGQYDGPLQTLRSLDVHVKLICNLNKNSAGAAVTLLGIDLTIFEPMSVSQRIRTINELKCDKDIDQKASGLINIHGTLVISLTQALLSRC